MSEPYFATGYVRLLYRLVRAEQVPAAALLQGTGFSETDLMRADFEMPFAQQMRFCSNALASTDEGVGLRVGYQLQLAAHGALGTAMQSAPDLRTALETIVRYIGARASFFSLHMAENQTSLKLSVGVQQLPDSLVPFFNESILFTFTHCLAFYTGSRSLARVARLGYPRPSYASQYAQVFAGSVEFGCAETSLEFESNLLSLASPEADAVVFAESLQRCEAQISRKATGDDVVTTIEVFLLENPGKLWSLVEMASLFAVSPRTLVRKLKAQGTSYQELRDGILRQRAKIYLRSMSVEAAALSLGFADTSSFRRTFKRWFGVLPSELRRS